MGHRSIPPHYAHRQDKNHWHLALICTNKDKHPERDKEFNDLCSFGFKTYTHTYTQVYIDNCTAARESLTQKHSGCMVRCSLDVLSASWHLERAVLALSQTNHPLVSSMWGRTKQKLNNSLRERWKQPSNFNFDDTFPSFFLPNYSQRLKDTHYHSTTTICRVLVCV